jgi:hypothetical protein
MGILVAYLLGILTALNPKHHNGSSDHNSTDYHNRQHTIDGPIVCIPAAKSVEEKTENEKKNRRETIKFRVEIVSAIVLFVYAGLTAVIAFYSIRAANAAKKAAGAAAEQAEMLDRPWVTISPVISGPLIYSDKRVTMSFLFVPKNIGHSPAQDVLIIPELIPVFMGDDVREEQKRICSGAPSININFPKYVLFPEEPFSEPFGLDMSHESIVVHWGKLPPNIPEPDPIPIGLVGCVDYTYESSPRHHQTGFAFDIVLPNGGMPLRSLSPIPPTSLVLRQHANGGHFAD